jgi:hypothetical protein
VRILQRTIKEIENGMQAKMLRHSLQREKDPMVYNIAELGIDLNQKARMCGIMMEDEGFSGSYISELAPTSPWREK